MPTKRLNYTGRRRINHSDARITLINESDTARFDAELNLQPYELPAEAPVMVEARVGWNVMRFPFGTVSRPQPATSTTLNAFDALDGLKFHVRVLDAAAATARILATAENIKPRHAALQSTGRSFLEVRQEAMGSLPWDLVLDEKPPLLLINDRFDDPRAVVRSDAFRGLVLPEVYRRMLAVALEDYSEEEDDLWQRQCLALAHAQTKRLPPPPEDKDAVEEWIDEAVMAFCSRHGMLSCAKRALEV